MGTGEWWITGVYGPQLNQDKISFLEELREVRDLHAGPWAVVGHFNLITDSRDKSSANLDRRMMARFRQTLADLELKEIYLNGWRYTWSNERERATLVKLDRVFASVDWEVMFPDCFLSAASTATSDHCLLILDLDAHMHMGRRFRFECFWPKADGFVEVVADAWQSILGNPYRVLDVKLKATSKALSRWISKWIGNIRIQILVAIEVIHRLDVAMDSRALSAEELALRRTLKCKLLGLSSLDRTIARQRSCLLYLKDGDANTRFFHMHASYRRCKNSITSLKVGDSVITGQENLSQVVDAFYANLLGTTPSREYMLNLDELTIPTVNLSHLDSPITEDEIWEVIKSMPADKAPGPDGFTGRFYSTCWHIIKGGLMRAVEAFSQGDTRGLGVINKALITLLPKKEGAEELKDFRPVSLVHGAIKIFDKALANRLAPELAGLLGLHQSAFVRGRTLHDNFMLVQATATKLHRLRIPPLLPGKIGHFEGIRHGGLGLSTADHAQYGIWAKVDGLDLWDPLLGLDKGSC